MYQYKIAGHTMGTPEYTVLEALELFKKIGLDGAEIVVQDGYYSGLPTDCSEDLLKEVRSKADELGLRIIALTPYNSKFNSLDKEVRDAEMDDIRKVIHYCTVLGAKNIRIYGGNFEACDKDPDGKKYQYLVESLRLLGEDAAKADVNLVVENHFNTMSVSAKQTKKLIDDVGHPNVGILYDQANLTFTLKEDYPEAIRTQMDKVKHVHVKDLVFKGADRTFKSDSVSHPKESDRNVITRIVGQGILDWPGILQMMRDYGYDGWLSLEYERRWHPDDIPDASIGMKESAEYLHQCFEKLH